MTMEMEVLWENLHQCRFVHGKSPDPGFNLGRRCGEPETNPMNYGKAFPYDKNDFLDAVYRNDPRY
jgi:hypothetical protein